MAASFAIVGRNNGFSMADTRAATLAYREARASFAQMGTMGIWYVHLDEDELMASINSAVAGAARQEKEDKKLARADRRKAPKKEKKAERKEKRAGEGGEDGEDGGEAGGEDRREGAHPRQPAGAVQARRAGLRHLPDR